MRRSRSRDSARMACSSSATDAGAPLRAGTRAAHDASASEAARRSGTRRRGTPLHRTRAEALTTRLPLEVRWRRSRAVVQRAVRDPGADRVARDQREVRAAERHARAAEHPLALRVEPVL